MTDTQVNRADYYHWQEPGRGILIYMRAGMVDRLQAEVLRAAEGGSSGAMEVGGILLGRTETGPGGAIVIEDFVPVACAHTLGPQYDLSEPDTLDLESALLRTALAACESSDAPSVLGYFRSHNRDGLSLSSNDLLLIDSYFQDPASVFLLVKTVKGAKTSTAGFFFWEDGSVQAEFSALEVALGGAPSLPPAIAGEEPKQNESGLQPTPIDDPMEAILGKLQAYPPAEASPPKTRLFWRDFLLRLAIVSLASVTVVLSVLTYLGTTKPGRQSAAAPPPAAGMLGLQVQRNSPDLLVTWDGKAPQVAAAHHATLFIRDGSRQKILDLDKTQLTTGSVVYTPAGDDIQFRLEVSVAEGHSVAQSVRLLLPQAPAHRPQ